MELKVIREKKAPSYTAGKLFVNDQYYSFTLEDTDRGLEQHQPLLFIKGKKVFAQTAIPTGRYEVTMTYSDHFKKQMPLIMNVPGFDGVRIHSGNKPEDTEGCLLVGHEDSGDGFMGESREVIQPLYDKITDALKKEKVFITYEYPGAVNA